MSWKRPYNFARAGGRAVAAALAKQQELETSRSEETRAIRRRIVTVAWVTLRKGYITAEQYQARIDRANDKTTSAPYYSMRAGR